MAKKNITRQAHREAVIQNKKQDTFPDEITLKDEILELKRQVMILKRTNEQYLVKLRKYEDEAKRKDKQLEQLMDPRKNSDITKVLSTKGAAILMNLKDQNNALIQMILNKDLHIRRLVAEIKMSKLYASTKKNECYQAEISRLRNLLIKSKETLKENVDVQEQSRSICVSGNSFMEFSSSSSTSEQSSPRDLDELRSTILSLEAHIQQSNDLLAKKNQEISLLRDEINFLKKISRKKTLKSKSYNCIPTESKDYEFLTPNSTSRAPEAFIPPKINSQDIINLFNKTTHQEGEKKWTSSIDSIPKYNMQTYVTEETTKLIETNQENNEKVNKTCSLMGKSLFHHLATDEIKREEKILSNVKKTVHAKEKWKKALNKYKELKKLNPKMFPNSAQVEVNRKNEISGEEKELQNTNNQTVEPEERRNAEDVQEHLNGSESLEKDKTEKATTNSTSSSDNETCQISEKDSWILKDEQYESEDEAHTVKEAQEFQSPRGSEEDSKMHQKPNPEEEIEPKESLKEVYYQSLDSSFDSEYGYPVKQEVQQMQVEVQINSVSSQSDNDQIGNNISETNQFYDCDKENNGCLAPEIEFNDDDDDVIIREK